MSDRPSSPFTPPDTSASQTGQTPRQGQDFAQATPSDLGSLLSTPMETPQSTYGQDPSSIVPQPTVQVTETTYIWGTNVNVKNAKERIAAFLQGFLDEKYDEPLYLRMLLELKESAGDHINVNLRSVNDYDEALYEQIVSFPQELIPLFDLVVTELLKTTFEYVPGAGQKIGVRFFNVRETKAMRDLDPEDIDRLISLKGMVTRVSSIIPRLESACFSCLVCRATDYVIVVGGKIAEPSRCQNCSTLGSMHLVPERSVFSDQQLIKLQESPETTPQGETPQSLSLRAYGDLVDYVSPGDRVEVTGILRTQGKRIMARLRTLHSIFTTNLDVLHFRKVDPNRINSEEFAVNDAQVLAPSFDEGDITTLLTAEEERKMREFAAQEDVYDKLVRSLAPSIFELSDIKKGLLCQLFGGTNKRFTQSGSGRFRGEINILLCGDPGTSKSQLLKYVHQISPRGIYTSGKGSSAVGLTAYVTKDADTRDVVLESGALVLSDRGICCIDEFDKMSDTTRAALHEAMEQQTISVAKAGIVCTLNARTSILAAANPKESMYNPRLSIVENLMLPPTLLSRFDLIYLVLDKYGPSDRRLAKHITALYMDKPEYGDIPLSTREFTQYISYSRKNINPVLSDEAVRLLIQSYVEMRKSGSKKTVTATPRQLESLIRISESLAKMRFAEEVEDRDIREATRLVRTALQEAATDPITGTIDMDLINLGKSATARRLIAQISNNIKEYLERSSAASVKFLDLVSYIQGRSFVQFSDKDVREALNLLADNDLIALDERESISNPKILKKAI